MEAMAVQSDKTVVIPGSDVLLTQGSREDVEEYARDILKSKNWIRIHMRLLSPDGLSFPAFSARVWASRRILLDANSPHLSTAEEIWSVRNLKKRRDLGWLAAELAAGNLGVVRPQKAKAGVPVSVLEEDAGEFLRLIRRAEAAAGWPIERVSYRLLVGQTASITVSLGIPVPPESGFPPLQRSSLLSVMVDHGEVVLAFPFWGNAPRWVVVLLELLGVRAAISEGDVLTHGLRSLEIAVGW
jgi:hypothetical protein